MNPISTKSGDEFCIGKLHSHKEVSLGIIRDGLTRVTIDDRTFVLKKGDIIFISPEAVHLCKPDNPEEFSFILYYIDPEWLSNRVGFNISEMQSESYRGGKYTEEIISSELTLEEKVLTLAGLIEYNPYTLLKKDLEGVKLYLEENYTTEFSIDDLSNKFSINKYVLIRKFKREFGISPKAYVQNLKIIRSKELLESEKTITDISLESGFYDQSHFIRTFKQYTGVTPEIYRQSILYNTTN